MSQVFPKFVQEQGSGKMILENWESYIKLPSGILYDDINSGSTESSRISNTDQQVTINYQYLSHDGKLLRSKLFQDSLAHFTKEFTFTADITEALFGMKLMGSRRIIIPPEKNDVGEYRVVDVFFLGIKEEKPEEVSLIVQREIVKDPEAVGEKNNNSKEEKADAYSIANIGAVIVTAAGSAPIVLQIIREIKSSLSNSSLMLKDIETQTLAPKLPLDDTMPQPKQRTVVGPKITCKVMDKGEGAAISKYQEGCFEYKEAGSIKTISFDGSPAGLALKLCPGFEKVTLEAIVGMKLNERRMVFIPAGVSRSGEDTFLDLKLTTVEDLNLQSRM